MKIFNYWLVLGWVCICFFGKSVYGQESRTHVSGILVDKDNGVRLSDVNVKNLRSNHTARSNTYGVFFIEAAAGDSLSFSKVGYGPVKTFLYSTEDILIEMQAGLEIETVVVNRMSREGEMREILKDYERKGIYNGGKNKVGTYLASPATALYNLFGREAKNAKRFEKYMDSEMQHLQVDRIFNKTVVRNETQLEDEELEIFMDLYRPGYDLAISWGQYDLLNYINRSFAQWNKDGRPKPQPLPKIAIPPQEK